VQVEIEQSAGERWSYDGSSASVFHNAKGFAVSCQPLTASSTFPTASLYGHCPGCTSGDTQDLSLNVDDQAIGTFEFVLTSRVSGWTSELDYAPTWYQAPIVDLMEGRVLTVSDGAEEIARFSLSGSSAALSSLRTDCN